MQDTTTEDDASRTPDTPDNPGPSDSEGETGGDETRSETPHDDGSEEEGDDLFPVERAADLTREHLPQQLLDEIKRPLKGKLRKLGQAYADAMDARNDVIAQLDTTKRQLMGAVKMSAKDSRRINNLQQSDPMLREALVDAGVVDQPGELPEAESAGQEDA